MNAATSMLSQLSDSIKKEFDATHRILSYEEYLTLLTVQSKKQLRSSAQYLVDMMDHFGKTELPNHEVRFKVFDFPIDGITPKLVGHEEVQLDIYKRLQSFVRQGMNNKLILLHGPNGSAKSTLVHAMMGGLERYSQTQDGAQYTFNWVFPVEKITKGSIGFQTGYSGPPGAGHKSYAHLPEDEVMARFPCDLKDHPFLLLPKHLRQHTLTELLGKKEGEKAYQSLPHYLREGDLCHRCKMISDAMLNTYAGDFKKVMMHIQVERIFSNRRYRKSLATVEPQMHVDAHYNQLTYNKSIGSLPSTLQNLNLFALSGDIVDGNRGIIEYSDLLKRPIDTFKYLLIACETGAVNIGSSIAYLDTVMLGSTNELQLDAFKEFPDFSSFKARIELIRVPYLLKVSQEKEIYSLILPQITPAVDPDPTLGDDIGKHITPHVDTVTALWSVLTRLKKPNSINYPPQISSLISALTPLEKAKLYDTGELPGMLTPEDRKLMRASLRKLKEEYNTIPYYEGRMGASVREIKSVLFDASQNPDFPCLSPLAVLFELESFVKRVTEYDFLKQDVKDGFHDASEFILKVRNEYIEIIDHEVRSSMGIYADTQWEDFLRKYVQHVSVLLKKEKIKNSITGSMEEPDRALISEFEKIVDAPSIKDSGAGPGGMKEDDTELKNFRQNLISQVGVWSLDHAGQPVVYASVFPEYWKKLEKHYFETQKSVLTKMHDALVGGFELNAKGDHLSDGMKLAQKTVNNMISKQGYCEHCAKEVITFLMKKRY
jgi:serine protein kinase